MPKGFDTTQDVTPRLADIEAAGYDFVARYLSRFHWKTIGPDEASAITAAGLALVLIYEDQANTSDYFSFSRGQIDGLRAAQQARLLDAPAGTVLYFAVDYDAAVDDVAGQITSYFNGIAGALKSFAASSGSVFSAGVYGSGATCTSITSAGLAVCGWLAQARLWRGHDTYTGWSICQRMPTVVAGLSIDPDDAIGGYGAIPPSALIG